MGHENISLPEGWLFCNGTIITQGVFKNQATPNISGDFVFSGVQESENIPFKQRFTKKGTDDGFAESGDDFFKKFSNQNRTGLCFQTNKTKNDGCRFGHRVSNSAPAQLKTVFIMKCW